MILFRLLWGSMARTLIRSLISVELVGLISLWDVSWCIGGDFNVTHFPSEVGRSVS